MKLIQNLSAPVARVLASASCAGLFAGLLAAFAATTASASTIQVTYGPAGSETPSSNVCSNCYTTFDNLSNGLQNYTATFGNTGITGTYTNINIVNADQYGGAGGTGKYAAVGVQSGTTSYSLALSKPVDYFGLWYSAGDAQNGLSFYSGSQLLSTLTTSDLTTLVGACNGSNPYCGNPASGADSSEPFAYLNFFGRNGTTFDRVVFSNTSTGTGFESDNHAVAVLGGRVTTGTTALTLTGTPEPATWLLLLAPVAVFLIRKRFA